MGPARAERPALTPFKIRTLRSSDRALVVDSWKKSYEGSPAVRACDREHYRIEMARLINRILDKATVRIACDPSDEDTIVGWVAYTGRELHWAYVKEAFRRECKVSDMLEGVAIDAYTFRGRTLEHALVGLDGCVFQIDSDKHTSWCPPKGWRFTPRFTL